MGGNLGRKRRCPWWLTWIRFLCMRAAIYAATVLIRYACTLSCLTIVPRLDSARTTHPLPPRD